ncbi:MAG: heavy metal translocating P-type ATPase, partial [Planctomycetota bacterium]
DLPIALGIGAGFLGGSWNTITGEGEVYFESVAILVFFLLCGRFVQQKQQRRAYESLELMHALTPGAAIRILEDGQEEVPILSLAAGDVIQVLGGETVPADGILRTGPTSFDLKVLSGETKAQEMQVGDPVFAGSINLGAKVEMEVSASGEESRVGRLLQLVEDYAKRPGGLVRMADRISGTFTVVVLILAFLTYFGWRAAESPAALEHAIALLIVACPCALGLATPLAVVAAVGRAARNGILVKGGDALERLSKPGILLLDKTGTISQGSVSVVEWQGPEDWAATIAALESHASHPFALALQQLQPEEAWPSLTEVEVLPGKGVFGKRDGNLYRVGSPTWMRSLGVDVPQAALEELTAKGLSPVVAWRDAPTTNQTSELELLGIGDPLQPDAHAVIQDLQQQGWDLRILSGDHPRVVAAVAQELGLPEDAHAGEMSPEDKLARVETILEEESRQEHPRPVVMVGDGWNDAAALAAADVGIAVHGSAEASLAAADAFLSSPGMGGIAQLLHGAERTVQVIRRNLVVSLSYNALGVGLAVTGVLNPLVAAVLMPLSSLTVVSIAWRSRTFASR